MSNKVLILHENPPISYLNALSAVGLEYEKHFIYDKKTKYLGLILIGGGDILPVYYGKNIAFKGENIIRDKIEFDAVKHFTDKNLPILAICRGMQLLNVYFGGTLKNVDNHYIANGDVYHAVKSAQKDVYTYFNNVNSCHCQAIDKLAHNAQSELIAFDGNVEAISFNNLNIIAVQFHPERMGLQSRRVFAKFAELCNKKH